MMGGNGFLRFVGTGPAEIWEVEVVFVLAIDVVNGGSLFVRERISW